MDECKHEWVAAEEAIFIEGGYADIVCLECDMGASLDEQGNIVFVAPIKMRWPR